MEAVQRLKTPREFWLWVVKFAYLLIAVPALSCIGVAFFFMALSESGPLQTTDFTLSAFALAGVIGPCGLMMQGVLARRRVLKSITAALRSPNYFWPAEGYEQYHEGDGKYLGIDTERGTVLYVHHIRKGQVDVIALTMNDWTNREVDGKTFRLYTKLPELPRIEINTPWAQRWFDTLGAMEFKQYSTPLPFAEYVEGHREQIQEALSVRISKTR